MTFAPVVGGTSSAVQEVFSPEQLSERTSSYGINGSGVQVEKDTTRRPRVPQVFIEVHVELLAVDFVCSNYSSLVDVMLVADCLPKFHANLVSTLPCLEVDDLPHVAPYHSY